MDLLRGCVSRPGQARRHVAASWVGGLSVLLFGSVLFAGGIPTATASTTPTIGDLAADVGNGTIVKLGAAGGAVLWSASVANDGAIAVDPLDFGVYTGVGSHGGGGAATDYKYDASGALAWTNTISSGGCTFYYVSAVAIDATSPNPGVVWTQGGCFGGIAKSNRTTGAQQWSVVTNDIGRASIDPANGQIYVITDAGPNYNYNTAYTATASGVLSSAGSCEGYTDLNPADGMLYRGGSRCGLTLSQLNKSSLGSPNWTLNLASYVTSVDALAVQPWSGGYIYVASASSSKIVVVDPATQTVVSTFTTAVPPTSIAVNPLGGNLYIANGASHFVYAYSPSGSLVWTSPDLGGPVSNIAAPRDVVGVALVSPKPLQLVGNATCSGVSGGNPTSVVVPAGATCTLVAGTTVSGNVLVGRGGAFDDEGAVVGGSLQASNAASIKVVGGGTIGRNLQVTGVTGTPSGGGDNMICNTTVTGNVQVLNNGPLAPIDIGNLGACSGGPGLTVGGNVQVLGNQAAITVGGNTVHGNLQVQNNIGGVTVSGNAVTGYVLVSNNH